jgi:uncharacterized protein YecE (DUF72 family)
MTGGSYIGTSGWNYKQWKDRFYAGVRHKDWLQYYATRFSALEVNSSFYRSLSKGTTESWYKQTPDDFRFAIKGHRYLTHNKKLANVEEPLKLQRASVAGLKHKLAVVLWQLPRQSKKNITRLQVFAEALESWPEVRHALEFRNVSWFDNEVAGCLADHDLAVALSDAADWPMWEHVTTDLVYVRLHGFPQTYVSAYRASALDKWAARIWNWLGEGRLVHVYFDNDAEGAAPCDALKLMTRLQRHQ